MGRGRQKAKAQRQARDIKYYSPSTDLRHLNANWAFGPIITLRILSVMIHRMTKNIRITTS